RRYNAPCAEVSPKLGWHTRRKSTHFAFYNQLAAELAERMELDPWRLRIESESIESVNFTEGTGMDRVIERSRSILESIEREYRTRNIDRKPALFIKNDSGTYGIGVMVIHSADELISMNRRTKNKMSVGKNRAQIDRVILQEGIPTTMTTEGSTSEPVIYMMGESLVGGFIRANRERDDMDNLNSQGMFFRKLCFKDLSDCLENKDFDEFPTLEAVYGLVAKLSALAAAMEIRQALQP
ncbi:MAG: glutamate--cysteine ligase, partial [Proteobacteria bacterium]|nr:glutamate--cysteine ligase [Pseudomonadota bacterium]